MRPFAKMVAVSIVVATSWFWAGEPAEATASETIHSAIAFSVEKIATKVTDSGTYEGALKNGLPNGQGKMTYTNGNVYEGEWANGERSG